MIRRTANGLALYHFDSLLAHPGVIHAVFTRLGGVSAERFSSLNVGLSVGDDPRAVDENHRRLLATLETPPTHVVSPRQVHGGNVAKAGAHLGGATVPSTDSLFTAEPGVALLLRFADCVPVLLYDARLHAVALAHAGWRGVVAGVVTNTLAAMHHDLGSIASDVIACVGPAIGPCCYTVGVDVAAMVAEAAGPECACPATGGTSGLQLDLPRAVGLQLLRAGVQHIEQSGLCTSCHSDEFFSHRAERGRTGRFAALLALRDPGRARGASGEPAQS